MTSTDLIAWFTHGRNPATASPALVGGKGARLIEMHGAGLPVPEGFCVTTEGYRIGTEALPQDVIDNATSGRGSAARAGIREAPLPDGVVVAITEAYEHLGSSAVAVRSSATAEDLDTASFAGQQDTYLAVEGIEGVLDAVRRCWASLWNDHAIAYRARTGIAHSATSIAVVIQRLVDADTAGVLFTADPVTGSQDAVVIDASYGLGESVVSGFVTPDRFTLGRDGSLRASAVGSKETRIDRATEGGGTTTTSVPSELQQAPCLDAARLVELAGLASDVEALFGAPQDVEWAFARGRLFILQSRPVTAAPASPPRHGRVSSASARRIRDDLVEHYPAPYPLDLAAVRAVQGQIHESMRLLGLKPPSLDETLRVDDDGIVTVHASVPRPSLPILWKLPQIARHALALAKDWTTEGPVWSARIASLEEASRDVSSLSAETLLTLLDDSLSLAAELTHERFVYYLAPMVVHRAAASLGIRVARLRKKVSAEDLLADLNYVTADITQTLESLQMLAAQSGLAPTLREADDPRAAIIEHRGGEDFLIAFDDALTRIGARTSRMYVPFSTQSWQENPEQLLRLIGAGAVTGSARALKHKGEHPSEKVQARLPKPVRVRWRRRIAKLRQAHVGREATVYSIEQVFILSRRIVAELAMRLVDRNVLNTEADIKFLLHEELRRAFTETHSTPLTNLAERRQRMRGQAEAVWWHQDSPESADLPELHGVPCSPGQAVGTVRIVDGPHLFGDLRPGEVLVSRFTDPTWTPLFTIASAVVVETGGPLSHAAIVAREYQIPAVLALPGATESLRNGDRVRVDGSAGTVTRISGAEGPESLPL